VMFHVKHHLRQIQDRKAPTLGFRVLGRVLAASHRGLRPLMRLVRRLTVFQVREGTLPLASETSFLGGPFAASCPHGLDRRGLCLDLVDEDFILAGLQIDPGVALDP
jgi:hypothetical protein